MCGKIVTSAALQLPLWLVIVLMLRIGVACVPLSAEPVNPPLINEGEILLFLQPMGEKGAPLQFTLAELALQRLDGALVPLSPAQHELIGADHVHDQILLARARVAPGAFQGLSFKIGYAAIMTEEGPIALQFDQDPLRLPMAFEIAPRKAAAIFLTLHADKSLESHVLFRPVFSLSTSSQLPLARLGYLSLPSANDLLIFHDNSMFFTGGIATGMQPRGMVIDRKRDRLYAALGGDGVAVVDLFQQTGIGTIRLRPGDDPSELALSADGTTLVSANYGSNTVSIMDPVRLVERSRVVVGGGPSGVAFSPAGKVAYSADSLANIISVIDTEKMTLSATISLEESPLKAAVSRSGSQIYVITSDSPNLLVVDLAGGGGVRKVFVGMGARSILVDNRSDFVYVGKKDGEIAVVEPAMLAYIDTIRLDAPVESMAISDEGNFLFALAPKTHVLYKVNLVSKEVMSRITFPGEAYGISLVGAR